MNILLSTLYCGCKKLKIAYCILVAAIFCAMTVFVGGSVFEFSKLSLFLVVRIYLPGCFWSKFLKTEKYFNGMKNSMRILLGTGFFSVVYCVSMRVHKSMILTIIPMAISVAYIGIFIYKNGLKLKIRPITDDQGLLTLLYFTLVFLWVWTGTAKNGLPSHVGDTLMNQDLLWNVGNASAFTLRFIPEDIRYSGVQLHYHYLTELVTGAISWVTDISCYNLLAFYMAPFMLGCVVVCLYEFSCVYFKDNRKSLLFTFSMFLFGCASMWTCVLDGLSNFFNDNAYHIITNINSQGTAVIFLAIFTGMFVQLLEKEFRVSPMAILIWLAGFFMLSFGKGPVAAIVAVGAFITVIWKFVQRKMSIRGIAAVVVMAVMFGAIYMIFFSSGANNSMEFSLTGTMFRTFAGTKIHRLYFDRKYFLWAALSICVFFVNTFLSAPLQVLLFGASLSHDVPGLFRLDGKRLFVNSQIAGGILAFYLFSHYALSQAYFLYLRIFFLHLNAVESLELVKDKKILKKAVYVTAAVAFITQSFMYVNFMGSGLRAFLRNIGVESKYPYVSVMNSDDVDAMEYFSENTDTSVLFVTNRINKDRNKKDGISNLYSALSARQCYMEGYSYAETNEGVPYYVISQRREIVDAIFSDETDPQELIDLIIRTGITHIVYSSQFNGDEKQISEMFNCIYNSDTVRIYATGTQPLDNHPLWQPELAYGTGIIEEAENN